LDIDRLPAVFLGIASQTGISGASPEMSSSTGVESRILSSGYCGNPRPSWLSEVHMVEMSPLIRHTHTRTHRPTDSRYFRPAQKWAELCLGVTSSSSSSYFICQKKDAGYQKSRSSSYAGRLLYNDS